MYSHRRRGQVLGMDFIIGLFLFIIVLLISVKLVIDIYPSHDHIIVYRDAVHISDNILSQGYPVNWSADDVILPGIAENNRINKTKLSQFNNIEYSRAKTLLHTSSDFIFFLQNSTAIMNLTFANNTVCTYGYAISSDSNCTPMLETIDYENLVRIDRLVLYDSKVVTLTIYAWN